VYITYHGTSSQSYTGHYFPYGITQILPPDTVEHTLYSPSGPARDAGTRFIYPGGMGGWVDLGGWVHTKMVCLYQSSIQPIQVVTGPGVDQLCWPDQRTR